MVTLEQGRRKFLVCVKEKSLYFCCSLLIPRERDLQHKSQGTSPPEQTERGGQREAGKEAALCGELSTKRLAVGRTGMQGRRDASVCYGGAPSPPGAWLRVSAEEGTPAPGLWDRDEAGGGKLHWGREARAEAGLVQLLRVSLWLDQAANLVFLSFSDFLSHILDHEAFQVRQIKMFCPLFAEFGMLLFAHSLEADGV